MINCQLLVLLKDGAVAQLGERLNGIQEVVGSIPISSTKSSIKNTKCRQNICPYHAFCRTCLCRYPIIST